VAKEEGDFILITGRLKNQWHTMTKTGKSPELLKGELPPFVLMNPADAREIGLEEGDEVVLVSGEREVLRVVRFGNLRRGCLFTPFGYPAEFGDLTNLLTCDRVDPYSKEPDLKYAGVKVKVLAHHQH